MAPKLSLGSMKKYCSNNPLDIVLMVVLVIFILSPIQPPVSIANMIDSTLGIVVISALIIFLFMNSQPALGIIFVIAVFELIRRSSLRRKVAYAPVSYTPLQVTGPESRESTGSNPMPEQAGGSEYLNYTDPQGQRDAKLGDLNAGLRSPTLEEEIVQQMAVPNQSVDDALDTSYMPIYENIHQASTV